MVKEHSNYKNYYYQPKNPEETKTKTEVMLCWGKCTFCRALHRHHRTEQPLPHLVSGAPTPVTESEKKQQGCYERVQKTACTDLDARPSQNMKTDTHKKK